MKPLDRAARPSTPEYDVNLNVMVPMRDGVRLVTDVYRPARDGRPLADRPVLLHRTPHNKAETEATSGQCRYFAARGYVVVMRRTARVIARSRAAYASGLTSGWATQVP
jgi:predicted acyl esterase